MKPEHIVNEALKYERVIRRDNLPQSVWDEMCKNLANNYHFESLKKNGEIVAWSYVSTKDKMDDPSDDDHTEWMEKEPDYLPNN